jgi:hypothetical protein
MLRNWFAFSAWLLLGAACPMVAAAQSASTETIVLIRHGEKPASGLGQLDCQGLNRSLALPTVIDKQFGKPAAVFAPDPSAQVKDKGAAYDYVRPLATIEPTAIFFGLPVNADVPVGDIEGLQRNLEAATYRGAFVLVAWEHGLLVKLAQNLMAAHGGDPAVVPRWEASDFDGIFIIKLSWNGDSAKATFQQGQENLDGLPTSCPGATP